MALSTKFWQCKCIQAMEELIRPSMPEEDTMRSELVFGAMAHIPNRFLLTKLASKATRKFHKPNTRIQDTTNDVFVRFSCANPIATVHYLPERTAIQLRRAS
jgi:hypothetical protein